MKLNMKKTFKMVVKGKTRMPLPKSMARKSELKLLGVTVNKDPCNWDTHFENMLSKVCTSLEFVNTMATFNNSLYCCLTACLSQIDRFKPIYTHNWCN